MSKKISDLNLVPGNVIASNLFFEVARQISANTYNGESERIAADTLIALLTNAGAAININLISTLTPTNAAWDSARTYTPYDYLDVAYQGKHYVYSSAKQPSAGHVPTEVDYWILIASDGAVGAVGPAGATGATGAIGPAGAQGSAGTNGTSAIATTAGTPPAIPAIGSSATYTVNSTTGLVSGQYYGFGSLTGTLLITAIPSATTVTLQNVDATAGATVAAGIKLGPVGKTGAAGTGGGGGASGIQYTYNTTAGSGVISAADLTTATSLSVNVADALGKNHSTLLGRLKIGAIIVVAKNSTNFVEYSVTSDYASGSVGVSVNAFAGSFASGTDTVYLSIVSDALGTQGPQGNPGSASAASFIDFTQIVTPAPPASGHTLQYAKFDGNFYRLNSSGSEQVIGAGVSSSGGRVTLTADRIYYVRTTGTRTGLLTTEITATTNTDADAFSSPQAAIDALAKLDINGYQTTLSFGTGTFGAIVAKNLVGCDQLEIIGQGSTSTTIGKVSSNVLQSYRFSNLSIENNSTITDASIIDSAVYCSGGKITLAGTVSVKYTSTSPSTAQIGAFISLVDSGKLLLESGITFVGTSTWILLAQIASVISARPITLNFSATARESAFYALINSTLDLGGSTIAGTLTTPTQYVQAGSSVVRRTDYTYV